MDHFQTALVFSEWALEFLLFTPFTLAFAALVISLVWAGQDQHPFRTRLWRPYHWLVLTHALFFIGAIAVGVLCACPDARGCTSHPNRFGVLCVDLFWYGSFASCAFWIWRMKGFRWYATSLMALMELATFGALFVAGMSVAGDWM